MATTLQQQLQLIRPQNVTQIHSKRGASILFDAREAVRVSADQISQIGNNGLLEISKLEPRLSAFRQDLFASSTQDVSRNQMTAQESKAVDKQIQQFLKLLSPFYLTRCAQECLEHLIRHYEIHVFNVADIMRCILPFHKTKHFARMIKLLRFKGTLWDFLARAASSKSLVVRQLLVQQCLKSRALLDFILDMIGLSAQTTTFVIAVVADIVKENSPLDEALVRCLLGFALKGLAGAAPDKDTSDTSSEHRSGVYLLTAQLATKLTFTKKVYGRLLDAVVTHADRSSDDYVLLLTVLVTAQPHTKLPEVTAQKLVRDENDFLAFLSTLARLGRSNASGCEALMSALLQRLTTPSFARLNDTALERVQHILCHWPSRADDQLTDSAIPDALVTSALQSMLRTFIRTSERTEAKDSDGNAVFGKRLSESLLAISARHGGLADLAVTAVLEQLQAKKGAKSQQSRKAYEICCKLFAGSFSALQRPLSLGASATGDAQKGSAVKMVTIRLGLQHPSAAMRIQAANELAAAFDSPNAPVCSEDVCLSVLGCIEDRDYNVVRAILKSSLAETVATTHVHTESVLLAVLRHWRSSAGVHSDQEVQAEIQQSLLQLLSKVVGKPREKPRPQPQEEELVSQIFAFLPVAKSADAPALGAQEAALKCAAMLSGHLAIFRGFRERESRVGKSWAEKEVQNIIKLLAANARALPAASRLCERLVLANVGAHGCPATWSVALRALVCAELQRDGTWATAPPPTPSAEGSEQTGRSSLTVLLDSFPMAFDSIVTDKGNAIKYDVRVSSKKKLRRQLFMPHGTVQNCEGKVSVALSTLQALLGSKQLTLPAKLSYEEVKSHPGMRVLEIMLAAPAEVFAALQPLLRLHLGRIPEGGAVELACQIISSTVKKRSNCLASLRRTRAIGVLAVLMSSSFGNMNDQRWGIVTGALFVALTSLHQPERQAAVECGVAVLQRLRAIADKPNTLVHHLGGVLQRLLKRKAELATDCTTGQLLAVHLATSVVKGGRSTAVLKTLCATATAQSALLSSYARYRLIKILCDVANSVSSRNGSQNALYKAIHSGLAMWFIRLAKSAEADTVRLDEYDRRAFENVFQLVFCSKIPAALQTKIPASNSRRALLQLLALGTRVTEEGGGGPGSSSTRMVVIVLEKMTKISLSPCVTSSVSFRADLLHQLVVLSASGNKQVIGPAREALHQYPLDGDIVANELALLLKKTADINQNRELTELLEALAPALEPVNKARPSKTRKYKPVRSVCVAHKLFAVLRALVESPLSSANEVTFGVSFGLQLTLASLRQCLRAVRHLPSTASELQIDDEDLDALITCVQMRNKEGDSAVSTTQTLLWQTSSEALSVLAVVASMSLPAIQSSLCQRVLLLVSDESLSHNNDWTFSAFVRIVHDALPPLLLTLPAQSLDTTPRLGASKTLQIFINAMWRLDVHQQEPLFATLLEIVGSRHICLLFVLSILSGKKSSHSAKATSNNVLHTPLLSMSATAQVVVLRQLTATAVSIAFPADEDDAGDKKGKVRSDSVQVIQQIVKEIPQQTFQELSDDEDDARYLAVYKLTKFVSAHLSKPTLLRALGRLRVSRDQDPQQHYLRLCEHCFCLIDFQVDENPTMSLTPTLGKLCFKFLDTVNRLLSVTGFLAAIGELLQHQSTSVRQKALQLFNSRLLDTSSVLSLPTEAVMLFLDFAAQLTPLLQTKDIRNVQTALVSLHMLARSFARTNPKPFLKLFPKVLSVLASQLKLAANEVDTGAVGSAMICIASFCRGLEARALPQLPHFMPMLLRVFSLILTNQGEAWNLKVTAQSLLVQSALESMTAVVGSLGQFLSANLTHLVSLVSSIDLLRLCVRFSSIAASHQKLLSLLSTRIPLRLLLPPICQVLKADQKDGASACSVEGVQMLCTLVAGGWTMSLASTREMPAFRAKIAVTQNYTRVSEFFLEAFATLARVPRMPKQTVLDAIFRLYLDFVVKLSEEQLRPLFLELCRWAREYETTAKDERDWNKVHLFWALLTAFCERLKSIIVPYFQHVWRDGADALQSLAGVQAGVFVGKQKRSRKDTDTLPRSKRSRADSDSDSSEGSVSAHDEAASDTGTPKASTDAKISARKQILLGFTHCLKHSSDDLGFIDKERMHVLLPALQAHLKQVPREPKEAVEPEQSPFVRFGCEFLAPCFVELAKAAASDVLWKPIHQAVLVHTRSRDWRVRYIAVTILKGFYDRIGYEFLVMLPESIPYLAEVVEDENEDVETQFLELKNVIEDLSGEKLDDYLRT